MISSSSFMIKLLSSHHVTQSDIYIHQRCNTFCNGLPVTYFEHFSTIFLIQFKSAILSVSLQINVCVKKMLQYGIIWRNQTFGNQCLHTNETSTQVFTLSIFNFYHQCSFMYREWPHQSTCSSTDLRMNTGLITKDNWKPCVNIDFICLHQVFQINAKFITIIIILTFDL